MTGATKSFFGRHKVVLIPLIVALAAVIIFQVFYPNDRMLPVAWIDGTDVSGLKIQDVVDRLNDEYNNTTIKIYFGKNVRPHSEVRPDQLGIKIGNADRVNDMHYPWYMRIIPSSILWYGLIAPQTSPTIKQNQAVLDDFMSENLGDSCSVKPVNASLYLLDGNFRLNDALSGGTCERSDVQFALTHIDITSPYNIEARIAMNEVSPSVTNNDARELATLLNTRLLRDIELSMETGGSVILPRDVVMSWLEFLVVDGKLTVTIDKAKSSDYYNAEIAPKVTMAAGKTVITTSNLTDVMREQGSDGKVLNVDETNQRIIEYLTDKRQSITIALTTIFPGIEYASQFDGNNAGLVALVKYYAETHAGTYGVRLIELTGQRRSVSYNADRQFNVAGAGRVLLGYAMLSRIEQGLSVSRSGSDESCVNTVLIDFNVDCVNAVTFGGLDNDARTLWLNNTTSRDRQIWSTADDLASVLERLYSRRLGLRSDNSQLLYNTLRNSKPRTGISSSIGVNNIDATGDKDGTRSDAAIVFTADSTYVLVILVEGGGSWSNVAELTGQIQGLISKR